MTLSENGVLVFRADHFDLAELTDVLRLGRGEYCGAGLTMSVHVKPFVIDKTRTPCRVYKGSWVKR